MGAILAIKFRQGDEEFAVQDLSQVVGLLESGVRFNGDQMSLQFQAVMPGATGQETNEAVLLLTREIDNWLDRARIAGELGQGPPVELLLRQGAILEEPAFGRGFVRWVVLGGAIDQKAFPTGLPGERGFTVRLLVQNREGMGQEQAAFITGGSACLPLGAGGEAGHITGISEGGIELTGGVTAYHKVPIFDNKAGTINLFWEPLCAKLEDTIDTPITASTIYDTRQDIDGGDWWGSDDAAAASWAVEWGDFPVLAAIGADDTHVYIYDANDMSLWATLTLGVDNILHVANTSDMRIADVYMLNRRLAVAITSDGNNNNGGCVLVDFENDRALRTQYDGGTGTVTIYDGPIAEADDGNGYTATLTTVGILGYDAMSVHMAYVPARGQVVAIGTSDGVALWHLARLERRASVSFIYFDITTVNEVPHIWMTNAGRLYWVTTATGQTNRLYMLEDAATDLSGGTDVFTKVYSASTDPALDVATASDINDLWVQPKQGHYRERHGYEAADIVVVATDYGVNIIEQKFGDEDNGAVQYLTAGWATGPLIGAAISCAVTGEENAASISDRSRNGYNLTVSGFTGAGSTAAADWSATEGIRGPALIFGGADYLWSNSVGYNLNNQAATFYAFVRPDSVVGTEYFMNKSWRGGAGSFFLRRNGADYDVGIDIGAGWVTATATGAAATDTWALVVGTFDGSTIRIDVYDELGNYTAASAAAVGTIRDTSGGAGIDDYVVGARADKSTYWNGMLNEATVIAEVLTSLDRQWIATRGFMALLGDEDETQLPGDSVVCNGVSMTEDGNLLLIASGDAGNSGGVALWKYRWEIQDRTMLDIGADSHMTVSTMSGLMIASDTANMAYESPIQDVYFFDYSALPEDTSTSRWTIVRGSTQMYACYSEVDGKIAFYVGRNGELKSTLALASWEIGDIIQLTFRYGYNSGVSIWRNRAQIGSAAAYTGFSALDDDVKVNNSPGWCVGQDYDARYPVGRMYDFIYWPKELSSASLSMMERGRSELPLIWMDEKSLLLRNRQDALGYSTIVIDNVSGDVPAGVRVVMLNDTTNVSIGLRGYEAKRFGDVFCADATDVWSIDGDSSLTPDTSVNDGNYLSTTASDTTNTKRAEFILSGSLAQWLRAHGRVRILARVYETGITPCHQMQFIQGYQSVSEYDYATKQVQLPATAQWSLIDCGEISLPPAGVPLSQRNVNKDAIDSLGNDTFWLPEPAKLSYMLERPAACTNDFYIDCLFFMPVDVAAGWIDRNAGNTTSSMFVSRPNAEFGAMAVGDAYDWYYGFNVLTDYESAVWTGSRMRLPVGEPSAMTILTRNSARESDPYETTLGDTIYPFLWVTPYFNWER